MPYDFLADMVVVFHLAYVSFVVLGEFAILLGVVFRWQWIRNPWFRWIHFLMIVIVAGEATLNITCPLTVWEYDLRKLAGHEAAQGSFVARLVHLVMFFEFPPLAFTIAYIVFALLVLATFWLAPPRRLPMPHWRRRTAVD